MKQSTVLSLAATGVALLGAVVISIVSVPSGWLAGVGVVLVGVGVFGGARGPVGVGVGVVAIASLAATAGQDLWPTLGLSALVAVLAIIVLVVADLSFAMRRDAEVSATTLQGLFAVHGVATALGIGLAVVLIAGVLAVVWPGWLLLLPAVVLGAASVVMARLAGRYNRQLRTVATQPSARYIPPPPPGIRSTMPPPPAPGARPTRQVPPPPIR